MSAGTAVPSKILGSFTSRPLRQVARLSRTVTQWLTEFLGYFEDASNGATEASDGLIELHRRIARGFRDPDSHGLRMLRISGGLDHSPHSRR